MPLIIHKMHFIKLYYPNPTNQIFFLKVIKETIEKTILNQ